MKKRYLLIFLAATLGSTVDRAIAQQGYEFEVYDTHLTRPGTIELELNANFVASGRKDVDDGLFPTHRMLRSSFEIGTGITNWLEASVYVLAVRRPGVGTSYVGNRVRATASVPAEWNLPFEFGLTQEVGYARPGYAENRWTYEVAPMIGKSWRSLSFVANPAFERGLNGVDQPIEFEPRGKISYGFGDEGSVSLEYFSSLGPTARFDAVSGQKHQLFVAAEKEFWDRWEFAASFGRGLTASSDRSVVATRLEYRLGR
ncbi:MAG TPA: hypothetical protein VGO75_03430 [Gemmatimonadaceae bacterium]|nr:hypothetical protein [Gemmatimonadaceae bacterium]